MMVLVFECGTAVFVCLCALRMVDLRWPRFEALLWLFLLAAPIAMVFARGDRFRITSALGIIIVFIYLVALGSLLARRTLWHRWKTEPVVLTLVMAIFVGIHDIGMLTGVFPADGIFYRPIAGAVASIVVGWLLISRFVDALRGYAKLNIELEGRVAQKHAELEENYKRMNQLERQSATVEERQRIMRDMHDGLGAQLISTLSLVEHGDLGKEQLVAVLRECLDDLRLTIDSLESTENDLLTVLGNFRYRLEPRLKSRGIQLDWQVKDLPKLACLTPRNVLHVLRILQEAFTNILKHAHANTVKLETGIAGEPGKVFVSVSDNGIGVSNDHAGHGFTNMRRRAQAIGGTLDIVSAATGTMITLSLPNA
jgi:signal transduction histidine kinase